MPDEPIPIDDIRALLEPEQYISSLRQIQATIKERISAIFAERDLLDQNPEVSPAFKKMEFDSSDKNLRDLKWRYDEAERRLQKHDSAKQEAVAPPDTIIPPPPTQFPATTRAQRRRKRGIGSE